MVLGYLFELSIILFLWISRSGDQQRILAPLVLAMSSMYVAQYFIPADSYDLSFVLHSLVMLSISYSYMREDSITRVHVFGAIICFVSVAANMVGLIAYHYALSPLLYFMLWHGVYLLTISLLLTRGPRVTRRYKNSNGVGGAFGVLFSGRNKLI